MAGGGEAPALDRREMLAQAIDLGNGGARAQQRYRHLLLVVEPEARRRQRQQGRAAARYQAQREIILTQRPGHFQDAPGGGGAGRVRHRMGGLDNLDFFCLYRVAIARHHKAFKLPRPMILHRARHGATGLAGADDEGPPTRRRRQMRRHAKRRLRRIDGGVEHIAQ